jgi:inner membrane protein
MQALEKSGVSLSQIKWDEIRLILGISDLKGIKEISTLQIAGANVDFEPGIPVRNLSLGFGSSTVAEKQVATKEKAGSLFGQGMNAKMTFDEKDSPIYSDSLPFSMSMKLNGSQGFYVVPVGKVTKVHLKSDWTSPDSTAIFYRTVAKSTKTDLPPIGKFSISIAVTVKSSTATTMLR